MDTDTGGGNIASPIVNPPVQQPQQNNSQQQSPIVTSNPNSTNTQNSDGIKENVKLKVVLYFIIGLFFNFLGLILGSIWIKIKSKTNQKPKYISLLAGFGVFALFSFVISPLILQPKAEKLLYSKYPELLTVKTAIESKYPNGEVGVGVSFNKSINTGQEPVTDSTLNVSFQSKDSIPREEVQNMGKLTCTTLESSGKRYDNVSVVSIQSLLPIDVPVLYLNKTFSIVATCEEWFSQDFTNVLPEL